MDLSSLARGDGYSAGRSSLACAPASFFRRRFRDDDVVVFDFLSSSSSFGFIATSTKLFRDDDVDVLFPWTIIFVLREPVAEKPAIARSPLLLGWCWCWCWCCLSSPPLKPHRRFVQMRVVVVVLLLRQKEHRHHLCPKRMQRTRDFCSRTSSLLLLLLLLFRRRVSPRRVECGGVVNATLREAHHHLKGIFSVCGALVLPQKNDVFLFEHTEEREKGCAPCPFLKPKLKSACVFFLVHNTRVKKRSSLSLFSFENSVKNIYIYLKGEKSSAFFFGTTLTERRRRRRQRRRQRRRRDGLKKGDVPLCVRSWRDARFYLPSSETMMCN